MLFDHVVTGHQTNSSYNRCRDFPGKSDGYSEATITITEALDSPTSILVDIGLVWVPFISPPANKKKSTQNWLSWGEIIC